MEDTTESKIYRISDAEMVLLSLEIASQMKVDINKFMDYNITVDKVNAFIDKVNQFEQYNNYSQSVVDYKIVSEDKKKLITDLLKSFKEMALRVEIKWGKKSIKYKQLELSKLHHLRVPELYTKLRTNIQFIEEHIIELIDLGLTIGMIDSFKELLDELMIMINEQSKELNQSKETTRIRRKLGNEIYKQLSYYSLIGKTIWKDTNPAKYNNYKLNQSKVGRPKGRKNIINEADNLNIDTNQSQ